MVSNVGTLERIRRGTTSLRVTRLAGFRVLALLRRSAIAMGVSAEDMFDAFDITGDGFISVDELQEKLCMDLGQDFTRDQIEAAIAVLDTDHDRPDYP